MRDRSSFQVVVCLMSLLAFMSDSGPVQAADEAEVASDSEIHAGDDHGHDAEHGADGHDAAHGSGKVSSPISVDPDLAIVTAVIFLGLLAVLWKFAWGPIVAAIDAREDKMANDLAEAAQANEESKRLLAAHEAKLAEAAAEVRQLLDSARRDADVQRQKILDEAQAAAQSEKERALREIHTAKNSALQEVAEKSVDTAVALAGKIVRRQLSAQDHSQLISDAIENFPSKN